ncbi:hypothetical protein ACMXYW_08960 [Neptuniibacter sp. QD48_55]|uniref:hypothetical protein n=1 Tax=Neptuniibacter sp. QD48_55 TaxID=3398212 RepID=UPI0039F64477
MSSLLKLKVLPTLLLLVCGMVSASDADEGKELYESVALERTIRGEVYTDANCETCHSSDIYTRPNRRVHTYSRLEAQVEMCNTMLDVGWFPDEVSAVATYLNQKYYKFD